jgi:hypothetical protein
VEEFSVGAIALSVVCEKCHGRYPVATGRYRYVYAFDDGKQLSIPTLLGYCNDCHGYKYIEDLAFVMDDVIGELSRLRSVLASIREERGLLSSKLVVDDYNPPKPLDISDISHIAEDLDQVIQRYRFQALRTAPPRCLECGGHNLDVVESHRVTTSPFDKPKLTHPGCGGAMHYEAEGHIMYRHLPPIRRYSIEGVFIDSFDPKEEA